MKKYRIQLTPIGFIFITLILIIQSAAIWLLMTRMAYLEKNIMDIQIYIEETVCPTVAIRMCVRKTNPALTEDQTAAIASAIMTSARRHGLDPFLLASVARRESCFNPNAVGRTNDHGLFQMQPATFNEFHPSGYIYDIRDNTEAAAKYIKYLINRFGDLRLALAAYNCGPSRRPEVILAISGKYADQVLSWWKDQEKHVGGTNHA